MQSPISLILANIFLFKQENGLVGDILNKLDYCHCCTDEILIVCDETNDKQEVLNILDHVHPAIKFTSEEKNDNRISFLDVLLFGKIDGSIKTFVFRQNTWTGQYTCLHSFKPLQYKINLVKCFSHRINVLCSEDKVDSEINKLKNTIRHIGFPDNVRFLSEGKK